LTSLKQIIQYADISDCDMEKGQMRCDVNISIRERGSEKFGTKVELKNLNSFRAVHRAIAYEMKRQILILSEGGTIEQETRGWNDDVGDSYSMRGKENAHDYRYFPEPDLLPVEFTDADIEEFKRGLPELPAARRDRFIEQYQVTPYDAQVLTQEKPCADYFEAAASKSKAPKLVANWIVGELMRELSESGHSFSDCPLPPENLAEMVDLIQGGTINGKIGKTVFPEMFATGKKAADIIKEKGLVQVSDEGAILKFIEDAIAANPAQVQQYREGRKNVLQFFVGQVMKASRGKANPQTVQKLLAEKLG
ncbi:MAG: Asp-tRNA(Asn)/Glu-tRNA(Gln) amidotransferase subunit GatB, partial [Lentisphaeria bacterium]|nr:Asp-tRNA(Asn)/Glu-tRNA(Gln) amidotransferase subunit GatB [Lentisphaeria bacterium]